ncbi:MAG: DNA repair protein RecN [Candidatus Nanopelagicales bacterium]|jgi:DNA repair protein RecN (Recombination protein N)|nr:DNA repair protein RecN [Candidatus Nanopelagicales bacterium]
MIEELSIHDIGVIAQAGIVFDPGFTVVTGETGAGKTMILTGVALVMGAKTDSAVVRTGAASAGADATFRLSQSSQVALREILEQSAAELEDDSLIISRSLNDAGRSKAAMGGRAVPASVLAEVSSRLVVVHGQADQSRLKSTAWQRSAVDAFAGESLSKTLEEYRAVRMRWRGAVRELADRTEKRLERERQANLHRLALDEIEAVSPVEGEDAELDRLSALLSHAQTLREATESAARALVGDDNSNATGAMGDVVGAQRALEGVQDLAPDLQKLGDRLKALIVELADLAAEASAFGRSIESDPQRLSTIEQRRHDLAVLRKKYGPELSDVIIWRDEVMAAVADVDADEARTAELEAVIATDAAVLGSLATKLTSIRSEAGNRFGAAISAELAQLAMPESSVLVEVTPNPISGEFGPDGADEISILLVPHPGAPARPIAKGASGGELSRIMLGMEVVLAGADPVPTFIFDEVDAGIGGKVAVEVGRRLAQLSKSAQVIVVTHLPQVAAFADRHIVVEKSSSNGVTSTTARPVEEAERVGELVRMLSGLADSDAGAAHAQELLDLARDHKSAGRSKAGRVTKK